MPVPFAGMVTALHADRRDRAVGRRWSPSRGRAQVPEPGVVASPAGRARAGSGGRGNVLVGYGTTARQQRRCGAARAAARRRQRAPTGPAGRRVAHGHRPPARGSGAGLGAQSRRPRSVAVISPLVRRMAREPGSTWPPSRRYRAGRACSRATSRGHRPARPPRSPPSRRRRRRPAPSADPDAVPLRGARVARDKLSRSRREIPEATVWVDVDATALLGRPRALNAGRRRPTGQPARPGRPVRDRRPAPLSGAQRPHRRDEHRADHVDLGFAAQTDRGLVVPVIHDAQPLTTADCRPRLAGGTAAPATAARPRPN